MAIERDARTRSRDVVNRLHARCLQDIVRTPCKLCGNREVCAGTEVKFLQFAKLCMGLMTELEGVDIRYGQSSLLFEIS